MVGPLSAVSVKNGRMLIRFFAVESQRTVSTPAVHVVGPDDADIVAIDDRAHGVFALKGPAAVAEQLPVVSARGGGIRDRFVDPLLALRETIRC
jgi:hypothetical protein